jgi:hypothetical protein
MLGSKLVHFTEFSNIFPKIVVTTTIQIHNEIPTIKLCKIIKNTFLIHLYI